jgi:hypothetical protein
LTVDAPSGLCSPTWPWVLGDFDGAGSIAEDLAEPVFVTAPRP